MFLKNVSLCPVRIVTQDTTILLGPNQFAEVDVKEYNRRKLVEVDEKGNLKSNPIAPNVVLVTENDKRTMATDMDPVVTPLGDVVPAVLDGTKAFFNPKGKQGRPAKF